MERWNETGYGGTIYRHTEHVPLDDRGNDESEDDDLSNIMTEAMNQTIDIIKEEDARHSTQATNLTREGRINEALKINAIWTSLAMTTYLPLISNPAVPAVATDRQSPR